MKKYSILIILLLILLNCKSLTVESSLNKTPKFTGIINDSALNTAITGSYVYIRNRINEGVVLGIANFNSPTKELSEYYVDGLTKQIVDDNIYKLVDIGNLRIIEQEMSRQLLGNVSDETAKRIGQQYGTDFIIIGSISQLGTTKTYRIKITITNIETTQIQGIYYADIKSNTELEKYLPENRNTSSQNRINPNQRIYYYRNITSNQFIELGEAFRTEASNVYSLMNANLIDGGTPDPFISYERKNFDSVIIVKMAGPYYTEEYRYSLLSDKSNPGAQGRAYWGAIMNRFNIEKKILDDKYGNPNISMFFANNN